MTRYGLLIRAEMCLGCDICLKACKDEFVGNDHLPYTAAQQDTSYGFGPNQTFGWPNTPTTAAVWVTPGQNWMDMSEQVSGTFPNVSVRYTPKPCMQCDSAPCLKAATNGGAYTTSTGVVVLDPIKSKNLNLVSSCPYGRIYWNSASNLSQKCTLCAHLTDLGQNPKCVDACPVSAITFGDLDDPKSNLSVQVASLQAKVMNPELGTKPRVYYSGLLQ